MPGVRLIVVEKVFQSTYFRQERDCMHNILQHTDALVDDCFTDCWCAALSLFITLKHFSFDNKLSIPTVYEHKKLQFQDWLRNKCARLSKVKLLTVERRLCGPLLLPQIPGPTVRVESAATWFATCLRGHVCNWPSWIIVRTAGRAPWRIPLLIPSTSKRRARVLVQMFHLQNQLTDLD